MPAKAGPGWWDTAAERYAAYKVSEGEWTERTARNAERDLKTWPFRFELAGLARPLHANDVTSEMIVVWKGRPVGPGGTQHPAGPMCDSTADAMLILLRGFLRWAGNPIAAKKGDLNAKGREIAPKTGTWKHQRGPALRRRWYDRLMIDLIFATASDRLKPMIALMAWVGLRRREAWSLTVGDVVAAADGPTIKVKRKGGKVQIIPIPKAALNALREVMLDKPPEARLYPMSLPKMDKEIRLLGQGLGIILSCHDLRRSWGRMLYYDYKVDINDIRILGGWATTEMAVYYIGADQDRLRDAVSKFDRPLPRTPATPIIAPVV